MMIISLNLEFFKNGQEESGFLLEPEDGKNVQVKK